MAAGWGGGRAYGDPPAGIPAVALSLTETMESIEYYHRDNPADVIEQRR